METRRKFQLENSSSNECSSTTKENSSSSMGESERFENESTLSPPLDQQEYDLSLLDLEKEPVEGQRKNSEDCGRAGEVLVDVEKESTTALLALREGQDRIESTLSSNQKPGNPEKKMERCPFCPKTIRATTFKKHLETHNPNRQKLDCNIGICRKVFSSTKTLKFHQRISHGYNPTLAKITTYECPVEGCGKTFHYKITRDRHVAKLHDPDRPLKKRTRSSSSKLNDSTANSNLDPDNQNTSFVEDNRSLMELITGFNHPRTLPVSNRHLECPASQNCPLRFSRIYDLNRHLLSTHPDFFIT